MKKSLLLCIIAAIGFGVAPTFIQLAIQSGVSQTCVLRCPVYEGKGGEDILLLR